MAVLGFELPFEIVVAHFNDDLAWLSPYSTEATGYRRGHIPYDVSYRAIQRLPDTGCESHAYLYHIVHNYD